MSNPNDDPDVISGLCDDAQKEMATNPGPSQIAYLHVGVGDLGLMIMPARRLRRRPFAATCRAAAFQLLRQDGGGAKMRLKPPDHTLVPRCCLLRQPPTTFVGAFFQRGGVRGCEG